MTATTHVTALRSTWRTTAEQYAAQAWRFVRLFVAAAVSQVLASLATGQSPLSSFDRKAIVAFVIPLVEVAWRQLHPALTASQVDSAPGATIVPAEVGLPAPLPTADVTAGVNADVTVQPVDLNNIPEDIPS